MTFEADAAALWTATGVAIAGLGKWVFNRLVVPRHSVQQKMLDDMAEDVERLMGITRDHGEDIKELKGWRKGRANGIRERTR